ncbi:unnamed protein product, partial [Candidula unifasciata]
MEHLPLVDILRVFNNPISEEQAWAVCYQCSQFLLAHPLQEFLQFIVDSGIHSIWVSKQGDVLVQAREIEAATHVEHRPQEPQHMYLCLRVSILCGNSSYTLPRWLSLPLRKFPPAVQALGAIIFETLDYGIDPSEERALSHELESLIAAMTKPENSSEVELEAVNAAAADDEGIVGDADVEHGFCIQDVIRICNQHVTSSQDAQHHYRAVCRALATEASELFTFLDKIASAKEKLSHDKDVDAKRLEELQTADWACLWVQVMRSLRQGVRLKKVEHIHLPPLEYELTPFEILLEDIRLRRYTLHKIMVNGDIPERVRKDAHDVILEFIRSRPPLRKVGDQKLKKQRSHSPNLHERLLREIRSKPKLRPVRGGKLV